MYKSKIKRLSYLSFIFIAFALLLVGCKQVGGALEKETHLFLIKVGGKVGFIDKSGQIVINPQFDFVDSFEDGLAMVIATTININGFELPIRLAGILDNKFGYIDKSGKWIWEPTE